MTVVVTDDQLARLERLEAELLTLGRVVVAFSGGADSAFLAKVATDTLGAARVLCATAVSPSLAPEELADCRRRWRRSGDGSGVPWSAAEMDDPAYAANDAQRCFHCKSALMDALDALEALDPPAPRRVDEPPSTIVLGVNVDDLGDHRPGQRAAAERGARFPLVDAGLTKADVRALSRRLGLRTWDKPAAACLASRLPYGTPVTVSTLSSVAAAESALRALGYRQLRVRHYGDLARIELDPDDLEAAAGAGRRAEIVAAVQDAGYRYVTLDLEGFRSGNLNGAAGIAGARAGQ